MKILLTNDDGIDAEVNDKMKTSLYSATGKEVILCAPKGNYSGAGASLSLNKEVKVTKDHNESYIVYGTPADSVYMAVNSNIVGDISMVISGINYGSNVADDLISSGTVGAALQGRYLYYTPIAFSVDSYTPSYIDDAISVACSIVKYFIGLGNMTSGLAMNVNIPNLPLDKINGIKIANMMGTRKKPGKCIVNFDSSKENEWSIMIGERGDMLSADPNCDYWLLHNGFVTITPIGIDLSSSHHIKWLSGLTQQSPINLNG